ncbi:L,D-transpeptidase [Salegentibacter sediminis]|uniref:L,D-transpeptidase n=1 Tax=Salegentibacter sediminis TaxID=1930251 RepID=UPI0012FF8314|nr:L,D-transpeptidase [Salegentibacter sediminis]
MSKYIHHINLFLISFFILVLQGCGREMEGSGRALPQQSPFVQDTFFKASRDSISHTFKLKYRRDSIKNWSQLEQLLKDYSQVQKEIIYSLNRIDPHRLKSGLELIRPDSISENFFDYSPFPEHLDLLDSLPKTLLVNQRVQAFGVYEYGQLCRWGPVSSGKQSTPTPNGLHYANFKAKRKVSTVNSSWIMPYYFNFMNFEGIGIHQYTLPGFPASHSCVRLFMEDAKYIYYWADMWQLKGNQLLKNGTPFIVFGTYNFNEPAPWLKLAENPLANFINKEELDSLKNYIQAYKADSLNFKNLVNPENQVMQ